MQEAYLCNVIASGSVTSSAIRVTLSDPSVLTPSIRSDTGSVQYII